METLNPSVFGKSHPFTRQVLEKRLSSVACVVSVCNLGAFYSHQLQSCPHGFQSRTKKNGMHTHTHTHTHNHEHTETDTHIDTHKETHRNTDTQTHRYTHTHKLTHIHTHTDTHKHTHTHTHTHTHCFHHCNSRHYSPIK